MRTFGDRVGDCASVNRKRLCACFQVVDIKVAHPGRQTLPGSSTAAGSADVIDVLPAAAAAQIAASSSADTAGNAAGISAAGAASATGASSNASSSSGSSSGSDSGSGSTDGVENIRFESRPAAAAGGPLLELRGVSIVTPNGQLRLVQNLNLEVRRDGPWTLLIVVNRVVVCCNVQ